MGQVIELDFRAYQAKQPYSADVYSTDMKKYQFEGDTCSVILAYHSFVGEAEKWGVQAIRCIAIYKGNIKERDQTQGPVRVWHQENQFNKRCY